MCSKEETRIQAPFSEAPRPYATENTPANISRCDSLSSLSCDEGNHQINSKLKEGKKRFWFGDVENGAGITDRYLVHPSLFYYSSKTSVNLIGDFNNIGSKSFTFKDYLDFEGGYTKILRNTKAYFSHLNGDFSQFFLSFPPINVLKACKIQKFFWLLVMILLLEFFSII